MAVPAAAPTTAATPAPATPAATPAGGLCRRRRRRHLLLAGAPAASTATTLPASSPATTVVPAASQGPRSPRPRSWTPTPHSIRRSSSRRTRANPTHRPLRARPGDAGRHLPSSPARWSAPPRPASTQPVSGRSPSTSPARAAAEWDKIVGGQYYQKHVAIVLDNRVESAPQINAKHLRRTGDDQRRVDTGLHPHPGERPRARAALRRPAGEADPERRADRVRPPR